MKGSLASRPTIGLIASNRVRAQAHPFQKVCSSDAYIKPTTWDTAYLGGIEVIICTWSAKRCPQQQVGRAQEDGRFDNCSNSLQLEPRLGQRNHQRIS